MDKHLQAHYETAPRFDESDLALSVLYQRAMSRLLACQEQIVERFGPAAAALAEELLENSYDVTELEARHFFQEGYRAALLDGARIPLGDGSPVGSERERQALLIYGGYPLKISDKACKINTDMAKTSEGKGDVEIHEARHCGTSKCWQVHPV